MFTPDEDMIIVTMVNLQNVKDWNHIASCLNGRSPRQVRERYRNYLTPGIINGPWTREEDDLLKKLFNSIGSKWSQISKHFPNRSEINIKNRWASISKSPKIEEDKEQIPIKNAVTEEDTANFDIFGIESEPLFEPFDIMF